jgi:hypothetical protein
MAIRSVPRQTFTENPRWLADALCQSFHDRGNTIRTKSPITPNQRIFGSISKIAPKSRA